MDAEEIAVLEATKAWVNGERIKWRTFKDTARHAKRIYNRHHEVKIKYCMCNEGTSKEVCKGIIEWYEGSSR
jgi:hypothetical protein